MTLRIARRGPIVGRCVAPASKPETQRALVMAALAEGTSRIRNPLYCRETRMMIDACKALGVEVEEDENEIRVTGLGGNIRAARREENTRYVWASGSALVGRLFATIGSAMAERVVVDGNSVLRNRPFAPLFSALKAKGVHFEFFDGEDRLPCAALSRELPGGLYKLGTSVSSQFATALMVPAPLATTPTTIELSGTPYSLSYIRQTADMMRRFGVDVAFSGDEREIQVANDKPYESREIDITGDYTSASYILGAAFVSRGDIVVSNLDPLSLQGERAIVDIVEELGARIQWLQTPHTLAVDCTALPARVDVAFDLSDSPNILPTVAAIAATIPGRVRLTGARLTQHHKCPRIDAMATELAKAGVTVSVLYDKEGATDGLEIHGRARHNGRTSFSNHGDHRIFMSLALFALACKEPCSFDESNDTSDSFPDFFKMLGLKGGADKELDDEWQLIQSAG
ncbi:MAG: 3-phosphoshikimate 1-carboxyvinyltransferase [Kiloniellales bacterium]|nr:3-phosphoshikimate 1-carboxyvinyltransferase [Kiloniellales bacterium]